MKPEHNEDRIAGEVATLNKRSRLLIPASVRKATTWLKGTDPIPLIAELVPDRQMRLHPADRAAPFIDRLRASLIENLASSTDSLAALADRYRPVTFYPSDTQVHLGESIALHLQPLPSPLQHFYVETIGAYIHVMTLEQRAERLARLQDELALEYPR